MYDEFTTTEHQRLLGRVLAGVYRLDEVIATGSTAVVFRGTHVRLGQPLAIKVLSGSIVANDSLISRFEAEAKVQAKLHHPNIVTVFDFVADGDVRAIAMEYVDGIGLDYLMYELAQPMALERIKRLIGPVMEAIGFAHERGIVHRDLKPSNILVTHLGGREYPKVMDFGIAKVLAEEVSVTAPGAMLGTLLFMSPEQCKALKTVDARSDIYSLGVTLYQMATGMVPFYSESAFDIMLAHVQSPPVRPRELVPTIPRKLEAVILRALEKDPEQRFRTVAEMAAALQDTTGTFEALGAGETSKRPSQGPPSSHGPAPGNATSEEPPGRSIRFEPQGAPEPLRAAGPSSNLDTLTSSGEATSSDTEVQMLEDLPPEALAPSENALARKAREERARLGHARLDLAGLSAPGMLTTNRLKRREGGARPARSHAIGDHLRASVPPPQVKPPDVTDGTIGGSSAGHAVPYPQELAYGSMLRLWIANAEEEEWRRYYDPNLAGGGVFVPTNEPPEVGATVRLEIAFGAGPRFFMTGLITWRRPPLRDPRTRAGVGVQVHPSERGKLQYLNRWVLGSVSDQRGRRRLPIKLQVAYTARTGRRVNFTRDLSETGVFVRSRELLDLDTPIELLLMPPHRRQPIRVQGRVSRLVRDPENRGMGISLAFRSDSERDHYALFIEDLEQKFLKGELSEEMLF